MTLLEAIKPRGFWPREAEHDHSAPILDVQHVDLGYDAQPTLRDVSFTLESGEQIAVVGPNGAGKSTLFKGIVGLLKPSAGTIRIGGKRPGRHQCIAYLPQRCDVDWTFPVTVRDVVLMGRTGRIGLGRRARRGDHQMVDECLDEVGLATLRNRPINELSGGEQQRMFIARALAQQAEIMLMDEPFSALDFTSRSGLLALLDRLKDRSVTVLVSLHDLNVAANHFDRLLLLNHQLIGFGRPKDVLTPDLLLAAYGNHAHMVDTDKGQLIIEDTCCDHGEDHVH